MIEDYIVSFTEGRIRLRHPALKDAELGEKICTFLQEMNGILKLEQKTLTGSLLIYYDAENISQEEIHTLLEQGESWLDEYSAELAEKTATPQATQKSCNLMAYAPCNLTKAQQRKLFNRSMLSTFLITLISGGTGNKRAHYMAGGAFAALTIAHLWRMRKII